MSESPLPEDITNQISSGRDDGFISASGHMEQSQTDNAFVNCRGKGVEM